jgi:hypothetical protein
MSSLPLSSPVVDRLQHLTRRSFLGDVTRGIGTMALGSLLFPGLARAAETAGLAGMPKLPHFAPKAKRVLCLFQSGGLSHVDLFDGDKLVLHKHAGLEIPASVKGTQRLTGMTSKQSGYPVVPPLMTGKRCGKHGTWISDLLPHTQTIADEICIIKSMYTEAINHDPAITFMNTGNQQPGYASMGAWVTYGPGSNDQDLPAFVVFSSGSKGPSGGNSNCGRGFLPTV